MQAEKKSTEYLIDPKELAEWLKHDLATQRAVTDRLFVSIFTIRSWWRGKTGIPKQYHKALYQMMNGEIPIVLNFTPEMLNRIDTKAVEKGFPCAQEFLADLIAKIF